jgi:hypothetical protein
LASRIAFIWRVLEELSLSGMNALGTRPCFLTTLTNMFHWPPSSSGRSSRKATVRSSTGRSAVSMTASRK